MASMTGELTKEEQAGLDALNGGGGGLSAEEQAELDALNGVESKKKNSEQPLVTTGEPSTVSATSESLSVSPEQSKPSAIPDFTKGAMFSGKPTEGNTIPSVEANSNANNAINPDWNKTFSGTAKAEVKPEDFGAAINQDKEEKGSRVGYIYNGLLKGVGSMSSAAADAVIQLASYTPFFNADPNISREEAVKKAREALLPSIRDGAKELAGAEISYKKEQQYNDEFITSALSGLASSTPAMISPYGAGLFLQAYDSGLESINNTKVGKDLPETTKTIFAGTVGAAQGALEKYGLSKIFGKGTMKVANEMAAKTLVDMLKKGEKEITKEAFEAALDVTANTLKKKALNVGKAALVEFETGSLQELSTILAEKGVNEATGKEVFEPKSWGEYTGRILYAGAQEAAGGGLLGTISQVGNSKARNYISEKVANAKTPQDIEALKQEIATKVEDGGITPEQAQQAAALVDKYTQINSTIPAEVENRQEVADLIAEKQDVQAAADAKLQEAEMVDEAFKPAIVKEAELLQSRVEEINKEIVNPKPKEDAPTETTPEKSKPNAESVVEEKPDNKDGVSPEINLPDQKQEDKVAEKILEGPIVENKQEVAGVEDAQKPDTGEPKAAPAINSKQQSIKDKIKSDYDVDIEFTDKGIEVKTDNVIDRAVIEEEVAAALEANKKAPAAEAKEETSVLPENNKPAALIESDAPKLKYKGSKSQFIKELKARKNDKAIHADVFQGGGGYNVSIYDNKGSITDKKFKTHDEARQFLRDWSAKNGKENSGKYDYGTITDAANLPHNEQIFGELPKDVQETLTPELKPQKASKPIAAAQLVDKDYELYEKNINDALYDIEKGVGFRTGQSGYSKIGDATVRIKNHTPEWAYFREDIENGVKKIVNVTVGDFNNSDYRRSKTEMAEMKKEFPDVEFVDIRVEKGESINEAIKKVYGEINKSNEKINAEEKTNNEETPTSNINEPNTGEGEAGLPPAEDITGVKPEKEKRKLTQQFLNDPSISKKFKDAITEDTIYYDRLPNEVSLNEANKFIDAFGEEEARKATLDLSNGMRFGVRMTMGQVLIKKMNARGYDVEAVEFLEEFTGLSTDMGQGIQALSLFQFLTPEGQVRAAKKELNRQKESKLKKATKKTTKIKKAVAQANKEAADEVVEKVIKKINKVAEIPPITSPKYGEKNKVVTKAEYNKLLKELRGSFFSNIDPRIVKIAAFHIEAGGRKFADFSETMIKVLGKKAKPYLKDLYKQAQDLFENKEGFETEEQIAQHETEKRGQELKDRIEKALKSGKKKDIQKAIAEISKNGDLWGKYRDMAVERLRRMTLNDIKTDVGEKVTLDEFTAGLVKNMRQQVEGEVKPNAKPKEAIYIIADAYKNFEKYQQVWDKTQKEFKEKYADDPAKLVELDEYFGDALKPFSEKLVNKSVKEALKSLDIKIADIVKQHYTVYDRTKKTLTDALIDEAGLEGREAKELADAIQAEFDKIATEKKKQLLDKIFSSRERAKPKVKELYKEIIEASNIGALSDNTLLDKYAEKMGYGQLTPEQANKIVELANKVQQAPDGHLKFQAVEDLLKYQMNLKETNWLEVPQAIWYANMLSGHQTHERNLVANIANTIALYANAASQHPTDAIWLGKSLMTGVKKGLLEASDVLKTGYSPIRGKMEIPPVLERKTFEGIMTPLNSLKYVRRLMVASDVLLFEGQKEMRAYQLAANMARKEGKTDPTINMRNRALEILNAKDGSLDEAIELANIELEGKVAEIESSAMTEEEKKKELKKVKFAAKRRAYEILDLLRPQSIQSESANFAARGTYNYQPEGTLGVGAKWMNNLLGEVPIARFAVPFTNIIANVANDAMNYTPYGFARFATLKNTGDNEFSGGSVVGKVSGKEFNKPITGQDRKDLLTKALIGTTSMVAMWALSAPGDDDKPIVEITANGTGDWRKNLTLREGGWQPYSFRIKKPDGTYTLWTSYQYSPLILAFGFIGNLRDFEKYRNEKLSDTKITKYAAAARYSVRSFADMTFLASANDMLSGVLDPRNPEKVEDLVQSIAKTGKALVIPNLYTQAAKSAQDYMDWAQKETRGTVMGYVLRDIPVARDSYNNQVNYLGEDVIPDSDVILSGEKPSKEWELLIDKNAFGSAPHPTRDTYIDFTTGEEKAFTQDQFYKYVKERGRIIKTYISENYNELKGMDKKDAQKVMSMVQAEATITAKIITQE